jgi:hypothetical protein
MAKLSEQLDTELAAFAERMAEEFNKRMGPWKVLTIDGRRFYHVKGLNNFVDGAWEPGDKAVGDKNGYVIIAEFLGGDPDDWDNDAVWDKSTIG